MWVSHMGHLWVLRVCLVCASPVASHPSSRGLASWVAGGVAGCCGPPARSWECAGRGPVGHGGACAAARSVAASCCSCCCCRHAGRWLQSWGRSYPPHEAASAPLRAATHPPMGMGSATPAAADIFSLTVPCCPSVSWLPACPQVLRRQPLRGCQHPGLPGGVPPPGAPPGAAGGCRRGRKPAAGAAAAVSPPRAHPPLHLPQQQLPAGEPLPLPIRCAKGPRVGHSPSGCCTSGCCPCWSPPRCRAASGGQLGGWAGGDGGCARCTRAELSWEPCHRLRVLVACTGPHPAPTRWFPPPHPPTPGPAPPSCSPQAYSLQQSRSHPHAFATATYDVPFYVADVQQFHSKYPPGSRERWVLGERVGR